MNDEKVEPGNLNKENQELPVLKHNLPKPPQSKQKKKNIVTSNTGQIFTNSIPDKKDHDPKSNSLSNLKLVVPKTLSTHSITKSKSENLKKSTHSFTNSQASITATKNSASRDDLEFSYLVEKRVNEKLQELLTTLNISQNTVSAKESILKLNGNIPRKKRD